MAGWGERDADKLPDYNEHIFWEPEDDSDDQEPDTLKLSSTTMKIFKDPSGHSIFNERRRGLRRKQLTPDAPFTKCLKLDPTIQSRLPKPAKDADHNLARLQTLILDAAAPFLSTLEAARSGSLTPKGAAESAQLALKLLGNASANISTEQRRKATTHLNPELCTLTEYEDNFHEEAPFLFGKTFDQQAKDHIEAVKSLKKTMFTDSSTFSKKPPLIGPGRWHIQGQRDKQEVQCSPEREKLSNTFMCKTFNENVECYKHSQHKQISSHDMHDTNYRSSAIKQGVIVTNQQHGDYTTFVKQYTDSSGVRVYTSQADVCDSVWSPLHSFWAYQSFTPVFVTMDPPWTRLIQSGITPIAAELCTTQTFAGRISLFQVNWKVLSSDSWVLQTVTRGYHIPLSADPVQKFPPHSPHLPSEDVIVLEEEIHSSLQKQAIQQIPFSAEGFFSNMFLVPKKGGGQRPVINLIHLNKFVKSEHFK